MSREGFGFFVDVVPKILDFDLGFGLGRIGAEMFSTAFLLDRAASSLAVESPSTACAAARRFLFAEYFLIGDDLLLSIPTSFSCSRIPPVLWPFTTFFLEGPALLFALFHSGSSSRSDSLLEPACMAALARLAARRRGRIFEASGDSDIGGSVEKVVGDDKDQIPDSLASRNHETRRVTCHMMPRPPITRSISDAIADARRALVRFAPLFSSPCSLYCVKRRRRTKDKVHLRFLWVVYKWTE